MAELLPSAPDLEEPETGPRLVGVDSDDADDVLGALSSDTSRSLLAALHEEPATPSELAERADTSLQNTQYHLEKLTGAELVEVAGTRYSEKGREMNVYAPATGPLVLLPDSETGTGDGLRESLRGLLGALAGLVVLSAGVQWLLGGDGAGSSGQMTVQSTGGGPPAVPPGLTFFLGGLLVVVLVLAYTAWRR